MHEEAFRNIMVKLIDKSQKIIKTIQKNHKELLQVRMATHLNAKTNLGVDPKVIMGWLEHIKDVKEIEEPYLKHVVDTPNLAEKLGSGALAALVGGGVGSGLFFGLKLFNTSVPGLIKSAFGLGTGDSRSVVEQTASGLFSGAVGALIATVVYKSYIAQYKGDKAQAEEEFEKEINSKDGFSKNIKEKSKEISEQLIKLFHFREMLLLGKMGTNPLEIDAREAFIKRANLKNQSEAAINAAIETYFLRELSTLFNDGFQELYEAHAQEIDQEKASPFRKWFHQFFDSAQVRQSFTQQIQIDFMKLCQAYLLEEKNEPTFFAKYPKSTATIGGLLVGALVLGTLALALGGPITWGIAAIALVAFAVATVAIYLSVTRIDKLHYKRSEANRNEIDYAVEQVENEFLRLEKEVAHRKPTSEVNVKEIKNFDKANASLLGLADKHIARGTMEGWLRDYAARYRHSKTIEIDMGEKYIELVNASEEQTQALIDSITQANIDPLKKFIADTTAYLKKNENQDTIEEFQLIHKIKEQVIHIVASTKALPDELEKFYTLPISEGGLGGVKSDLSAVINLAPINSKPTTENKNVLLDAAYLIFKSDELLYSGKKWLKGDAELRSMLGLPKGKADESALLADLSIDTVDAYLKNSYEFLFMLNPPIHPGNINPLEQALSISPQFRLYKTLLLKQLANLCDPSNSSVDPLVKSRIKEFVKERFLINPELVFDDLMNQHLMMEELDETAGFVLDRNGITIYKNQLQNVAHAIHLNIAYNSVFMTPRIVLDCHIREFLTQNKLSAGVFAYDRAETQLNPQGSQQFVQDVATYITNTKNFLDNSNAIPCLKKTGIRECYKAAMSAQVYQIMLRIAKDINEMKADDPQKDTKQAHLLEAFKALRSFSNANCYPLKKESSNLKIFDLLSDSTFSQESLKVLIPDAEKMLNQISGVSDDLQLNSPSNMSIFSQNTTAPQEPVPTQNNQM